MLFMTHDMHFLSCSKELRVDIRDLRNNYVCIPLIWLQDSSLLHVYPFFFFFSVAIARLHYDLPFWDAVMASGRSVRMVLATVMTAKDKWFAYWATNVGV
jgi:hypothetical protein